MDKYQEFILANAVGYISTDQNFNKNSRLIEFLDDNGNIIITQDENYNIKERYLMIASNAISYVEIDGSKIEKKEKTIVLSFDFDKKAKTMKIYFEHEYAEPLTLSIKFVEADHSIYDSKIQAKVNESIKPEHKTGTDLVNIYWNLVSDDVEETRIILYSVTNGAQRLIGKYKETEAMFKSITGLAFGTYMYEIIEFDKNGKELARTPKISFTLSTPNYSGRHTVII